MADQPTTASLEHGPKPGEKAPDVKILPSYQNSPTLHAVMNGAGHTLLLFGGAARADTRYPNLAQIARRVGERYGERVKPVIVVPLVERPEALGFEIEVLLDPEATVHRRYGAGSECLYLVTPDGHIGYRGQPADGEKLMAQLGQIVG